MTASEHEHAWADSSLWSSDLGIRALKISLALLAVTAVVQLIVALASRSAALLADTFHNFADAFTTVPLWLALALARRAANRRFTYGYGRAEDLAGVVVLLFILFSAGLAIYEAVGKFLQPGELRFAGWAAIAAVAGAGGNEAAARVKIRAGEKIGSAALIAEGKHSRADTLSSLAAFAGILGTAFGFPLADPLAGLLISFLILRLAWEVGRDVLGRLMDAIEPDTVNDIERIARDTPGAEQVHDIRARWLGHAITIELHVSVDGRLPLVDAHAIGESVRARLLTHVPRVTAVIVHVDPLEAYAGQHHSSAGDHPAHAARMGQDKGTGQME